MSELTRVEPARKAPLLTPLLLWFMFTMVLANVASTMWEPLFPLYLRSLGADVVQVGLFFTLSQIAPLAMQILGGWISDSLGRLRSIALGSVAGLAAYAWLILALTWYWLLFGEVPVYFKFHPPSNHLQAKAEFEGVGGADSGE